MRHTLLAAAVTYAQISSGHNWLPPQTAPHNCEIFVKWNDGTLSTTHWFGTKEDFSKARVISGGWVWPTPKDLIDPYILLPTNIIGWRLTDINGELLANGCQKLTPNNTEFTNSGVTTPITVTLPLWSQEQKPVTVTINSQNEVSIIPQNPDFIYKSPEYIITKISSHDMGSYIKIEPSKVKGLWHVTKFNGVWTFNE